MKTIQLCAATAAITILPFHVHAVPLFSDAGFGPGDATVIFNEITLAGGTAVTDQFNALGVTFASDGPGAWRSSTDPDFYSSLPGFDRRYLDSFSGEAADAASAYSILFSSDVTAAGAFWEFDASPQAATFAAYLDDALIESFSYNNVSCCNSSEFLGFSGILFDELRISDITFDDFVMDTLSFSPAVTAVPEPGSLALVGLGLGALFLSRRHIKA